VEKIIIAIDGYSSCGKSTLAKQLAKTLNYIYIDTGAMYRAVTWYALRNDLLINGELRKDELIKKLDQINVSFSYEASSNRSETYLNGKNIEQAIRGMEVSNHVSKIAQIKEVRNQMVKIQRTMGESKGLVMDGRDIGSVVFPNAELKIFMTADYKVRAERRFNELIAKGNAISLEQILENIESRDNDDSRRSENPLIQVDDAIVVDNSNLTKEEQFDFVLNLSQEKINSVENLL